jgi:hypothetical protein
MMALYILLKATTTLILKDQFKVLIWKQLDIVQVLRRGFRT